MAHATHYTLYATLYVHMYWRLSSSSLCNWQRLATGRMDGLHELSASIVKQVRWCHVSVMHYVIIHVSVMHYVIIAQRFRYMHTFMHTLATCMHAFMLLNIIKRY